MTRLQSASQFRWSGALALAVLLAAPAQADETCMSPYSAKITGQEDFVYVWTLGAEGVGDGSDKLVTIDARPGSATYGKVVHSVSVGGRHEAHHAEFNDDRRYLWAGGLDTSRIFVFDMHSDPARPKLHMTIADFVQKSGGVVGPHTFYPLPGRMLISGLSNDRDHGGRTALARGRAADQLRASLPANLAEQLKRKRKLDLDAVEVEVHANQCTIMSLSPKA